jgi:signal transduction histidine kinase
MMPDLPRPAVPVRMRLDWVLNGLVTDNPEARRFLVVRLYLTYVCLSAVGAVVYQFPRWPVIASGRLLVGTGLVMVISRPRRLGFGRQLLMCCLPAAFYVTGVAVGAPGGVAALTAMVVLTALNSVIWERVVVIPATIVLICAFAGIELSSGDSEVAVATVVSFASAMALVVWLVNGTAVNLRERVRELQRTEVERDRVRRAVDGVADRERAKVASELHDDTIQVMTAASLKLGVIQRSPVIGTSDEGVRDALDLMQLAIDRARRMSFDLYPQLLEEGLEPAVADLGTRLARDAGFVFELDISPQRHPRECERLAYRTLKELLENVRKHACADRVRVAVGVDGGLLRFSVIDDGHGFDPDLVEPDDGQFHFGREAAAERVRRVGGTFATTSSLGMGTRVEVSIPLEPAPEPLLGSDGRMEQSA